MPLDAIEREGGLPVVWATAREVVVWKPPGMPSELPEDRKRVSAIERVRSAGFARARLPHRLDRIARGLLLIALDDASIAHHNEQIRAGAWGKWYLARLALRAGMTPGELLGAQRAYLKRKGARAELVRAGGQPSRLEVLASAAVLDRAGREQRGPGGGRGEGAVGVDGGVRCDALIALETGRYHQIRAMMGGLGAPLLGDELYGGPAGEAYLEHFALRFVPADRGGEAVMLNSAGHGHRPKVCAGVWEAAMAIGRDRGSG
ncbi:MAG: pseudouridine synthase [Phycisphaerales bacterium]